MNDTIQLDLKKKLENCENPVVFFADFCGFLNFVLIWLNSIIHTDSNFSYIFTSFETLTTLGMVWYWNEYDFDEKCQCVSMTPLAPVVPQDL